jgi:hypothetical protein
MTTFLDNFAPIEKRLSDLLLSVDGCSDPCLREVTLISSRRRHNVLETTKMNGDISRNIIQRLLCRFGKFER